MIKKITLIFPKDNWIEKVKEFFKKDEPVALPTETVYGLAAPANQAAAVARIYEIKDRPAFNPLILHVREDWDLSQWAELGEVEKKLIEKFWPGPLSILVPKKNVSDLVTAGSNKVVLRAPKNEIFRELLSVINIPLVAPSANSSTRLSPTTAQAVIEDLGEKLAAVVDGGPCELGLESTIVEVRDKKIVVLREGALPREEISEFFELSQEKNTSDTITPGSSLRHYAPKIPLFLFDHVGEWERITPGKKTLWLKVLKLDGPDEVHGEKVFCLAPDDDYKTAAQGLFEFLRKVQSQYTELRVLKTNNQSLGRAINDRLLRASER